MITNWLDTLHKSADWYAVTPTKRTFLQRLAFRTKGVVTPANVASIAGLGFVLAGLALVSQGSAIRGIALILVGRIFDILDGHIARRTRTSSSLGEELDATLDKVAVIAACIVLGAKEVIPPFFITFVLLEQTVTALFILVARYKGVRLHPARLGKYATFVAWIGIIGFGIAYVTQTYELQTTIYVASSVIMAVACVMLAGALSQYVATYRFQIRGRK